jgi:hypothetical protein
MNMQTIFIYFSFKWGFGVLGALGNFLLKKISKRPKNHLKPSTQCPKSTRYKGKLPNAPKTT